MHGLKQPGFFGQGVDLGAGDGATCGFQRTIESVGFLCDVLPDRVGDLALRAEFMGDGDDAVHVQEFINGLQGGGEFMRAELVCEDQAAPCVIEGLRLRQ